ncbi:ribose 5-phosphate isomerase B [Dissulfurirhabdus thermomarina]|uniref:Ribose 5-phosphate isomerase B n=1 Tax=Dissulfurirhabdus thermomarina TaxID=1765737 RepID=A0A6N9TM38_DISTH|nr:ribose 5-phosphate isomerase B [Dissulfurirhabdus thermomarina]NDY42189.1 ribose 5-phosphate isomerase B [Dissulfurirhabdus thermomarina]NMX22529.1 ribose 5-phosphate isomerase B [Dissulfurirhabdus thermomarina]
MKVAIGSDHGGFDYKERLKAVVADLGHEVVDVGCHSCDSTDYPLQGREVARLVAGGECERGILICGTGIGMSMTANRVPGVRAALCHELFTARMSREHNDANVLCLGQRVIGLGLAEEMVRLWLETPFSGGRHARRVALIEAG